MGKNLTKKCKIDHMTRHALLFQKLLMDSIWIIEYEFLSYLALSSVFIKGSSQTIYCLNANALSGRPWKEIKRIIEKVHKHVCYYVKYLITIWRQVKSSAPPEPPRKVSISSMSK